MRRLWPAGGLWRHPDFLKLWSAETISQFGSQVGQLALPFVAVIVLDSTPFEVAALGTIMFLPFILFTLPAGVWVDRMRRRRILIAGDLGRFALEVTVPIAYVFDVLTIWQLYVVGFAYGICTVFFDVAYQSYLPSLVEREQLVDGNSKLEISRSAAAMTGPGLGGILVQVLTAPYAVLLDAISFLGSGLFLLGIRKHEEIPEREDGAPSPPVHAPRGARGPRLRAEEPLPAVDRRVHRRVELRDQHRVRDPPRLRGAELDLSPAVIGIVFSIASVGALAGALTATRVASRLGVGPTIVGGALAFGPSLLLIPAAPVGSPIPFLIASFVIGGYGGVVYNITQLSFRQAICPERLQGRMNSVMRFIVWGVMPLGSLLGGALATWIGLHETLWIGAIIGSVAFLPVLLSPVRTLREMPAQVADTAPEPAGA